MSPPSLSYIEYWYQALATDIGLCLSVSDIELAKRALYSARKAAGDEQLSSLILRASPYHPESELWILKKELKNDGSGKGQVLDLDPGESG